MKNIEVDENRRIFIGTSAVALCSVAIASAGLITPNLASAQSKASTGPAVIGQPDTKGIAVERVSYPSRNADSLYFSEVAYKNAKEPKELHLVPAATHIDLYDKTQYVDPAVAKLTGFFGQYLV